MKDWNKQCLNKKSCEINLLEYYSSKVLGKSDNKLVKINNKKVNECTMSESKVYIQYSCDLKTEMF